MFLYGAFLLGISGPKKVQYFMHPPPPSNCPCNGFARIKISTSRAINKTDTLIVRYWQIIYFSLSKYKYTLEKIIKVRINKYCVSKQLIWTTVIFGLIQSFKKKHLQCVEKYTKKNTVLKILIQKVSLLGSQDRFFL